MKPYAVGVDVGGTTVKIGIFSKAGDLFKKWEIPTRTENNGQEILPDIAASIRETLQDNGLSLEQVEGVGIDVPGAVLDSSVVNRAVNLGWGVVPVSTTLSALIDGVRVEVCNDANAAALGEMWKGGGAGFDNIVMVTLGTGVGGGIILGGRILDGAAGAAGEIGHINVNEHESAPCGCGKCGHLEQYASATGIANIAAKKLAEGKKDSSLKQYDEVTAKEVFDEAKKGDALALEIVEEVTDILGRALGIISCVVDPEAFVIGGGVSKAGQIPRRLVGRAPCWSRRWS